MKIVNLFSSIVLAFVSVSGVITAAVSVPEPLGYLPSNCEMVAIIPSLSSFETEMNKLAKKFGIDQELVMADVVTEGVFSEKLDIDPTKPVCLALTNIMAADNSVVLLLPFENPETVLSNLGGTKLASGVIKLRDDVFMIARGKYLMVTSNEFNMNLVLGSSSPLKLSDMIIADMNSSEMTVFANITNVMNVVRPLLPTVLMNMPDYTNNPEIISGFQRIFSTFAEIETFSMAIDFSDKGLIVKENFSLRSGGTLAPVLKSVEKVSLSSFEKMPDGDLVSLSAMNVSPELVKVAYNMVIDLISIGAASTTDGLTSENYKELGVIVDKVLNAYGDKIGQVVTADYLSKIEKEQPEEQIFSLTKSDLTMDAVKSIWKDLAEISGLSMYKIDSCTIDAGEINGIKYSSMKITVNQSLNNQTITDSTEVFLGESKTGLMVQASDKDIFAESVIVANGTKTLKNHPVLKISREVLPAEANFYLVLDVNAYAKIFLAGYNQQAPLVAQASAESAIALAMAGPVINKFAELEGTTGFSIEVQDNVVRTVAFLDSELLDSAAVIAGNLAESYMGTEDSAEPENATEF